MQDRSEKYELLLEENEALKKDISLGNEQLKDEPSVQDNSNMHLQEELTSDSGDASDLKKSNGRQQARMLNKTITDLHEELKQSNQARKQAVRYLSVCHDKSQELANDLEHCIHEKNAVEVSFEQQVKHEQEARVKLDGSVRRWRLYSVIASALIVVLIMMRFL